MSQDGQQTTSFLSLIHRDNLRVTNLPSQPLIAPSSSPEHRLVRVHQTLLLFSFPSAMTSKIERRVSSAHLLQDRRGGKPRTLSLRILVKTICPFLKTSLKAIEPAVRFSGRCLAFSRFLLPKTPLTFLFYYTMFILAERQQTKPQASSQPSSEARTASTNQSSCSSSFALEEEGGRCLAPSSGYETGLNVRGVRVR